MNGAAQKPEWGAVEKIGAKMIIGGSFEATEAHTHRPAPIGRLFGLIFTLAIVGLPFTARAAKTDSLVPVSSLGALSANDSVPWSQLGADGTLLSSAFNANSLSSIAVNGSLAASGSLVSVVCPASQCSWRSAASGGFSAADAVIWTSDTANG